MNDLCACCYKEKIELYHCIALYGNDYVGTDDDTYTLLTESKLRTLMIETVCVLLISWEQ